MNYQKKIENNRDLINNLLESDLPLDQVYSLIRRLASDNEDMIKKLSE